MQKTYWEIIWTSFRRTHGALLAVIDVALAVLLWFLKPESKVPLVVVVPVFVLAFILLITLVDAGVATMSARYRLPRLLYVHARPGRDGAATVLTCLLEPSDLFSFDAAVSIYYKGDRDFEQLIGMGQVSNIQEDHRIQVSVIQTVEGHEETIKAMAGNQAHVLDRIIVKPSVASSLLSTIRGV
jgi:MFS-type transporter involved in bile tolerance (Atg22 family)